MTSRPYSSLAKPGNIYVRSVLSLPPITAMRFHRDEGVRGSPRFTCEAHEKDDAGGHATTGRARRSLRRLVVLADRRDGGRYDARRTASRTECVRANDPQPPFARRRRASRNARPTTVRASITSADWNSGTSAGSVRGDTRYNVQALEGKKRKTRRVAPRLARYERNVSIFLRPVS